MSRKSDNEENDAGETETSRQKFQRVANMRLKKVRKYSKMLRITFKSSVYEKVPEDCKKLLDDVEKDVLPMIEELRKLSEGETLSTSGSTDVSDTQFE